MIASPNYVKDIYQEVQATGIQITSYNKILLYAIKGNFPLQLLSNINKTLLCGSYNNMAMIEQRQD